MYNIYSFDCYASSVRKWLSYKSPLLVNTSKRILQPLNTSLCNANFKLFLATSINCSVGKSCL